MTDDYRAGGNRVTATSLRLRAVCCLSATLHHPPSNEAEAEGERRDSWERRAFQVRQQTKPNTNPPPSARVSHAVLTVESRQSEFLIALEAEIVSIEQIAPNVNQMIFSLRIRDRNHLIAH